jgi:predicted Rossmann fold nucleotide-binding protein DprA/Smf involved in DNA uptake
MDVTDRILVELAERGALTADGLGDALGTAPSEVSAALVMLEIEGRICRQQDGTYRLV